MVILRPGARAAAEFIGRWFAKIPQMTYVVTVRALYNNSELLYFKFHCYVVKK